MNAKMKALALLAIMHPLAACATNVTARISVIDYDTQQFATNIGVRIFSDNPYGMLVPGWGWTHTPSASEFNLSRYIFDTQAPKDCDFITYNGWFSLSWHWFGDKEGYGPENRQYKFEPVPGKGGEFATLAETYKEMTFYFREKRNPVIMYSLGGGNRDFYTEDEWSTMFYCPKRMTEAGFDMIEGDWCPPFGKGKTADFYVQKSVVTNGEEQITAALVFKGKGNGAYLDQKRPCEGFWSAYNADPDAVYSQTFTQNGDFIVGTNDYLVVRTRCVVDESGAITSARYGKIYGAIRVGKTERDRPMRGIYFFFKSYALNPKPNDTNLEVYVGRGSMSLIPGDVTGRYGAGYP